MLLLCPRHERSDRAAFKNNIRIGKEQIIRGMRHAAGEFHPLLLRPQLAGPACRQRPPRNNGQALAGAQRRGGLARDAGGGVAALIVDQHDVERSRVVLA